jgi:putative hydrolase of the HAD superfamily
MEENHPVTPDALPPAIILDLDDTILDDSLASDECWAAVAALHAPGLAPITEASLLAAIQRARAKFWDDATASRKGLDLELARRTIMAEALTAIEAHDVKTLAERIAADYGSLRDAAMRPLPGALETVAALRERRVRLGMITNGGAASQRAKVERFALASHFDVIVIEGEFGCGKPDERVYRHALAALGATPEATWMVGDSLQNDVLAPQRLGLTGVWVNPSGRALPPGALERPGRVIRALSELL